MLRADRLLKIIQVMRRFRRPVTAARIAEEMEVSVRTIYRDIVTLQGAGVPISGEAGVGYVMGEGYELPPLMFDAGELEAIMLGMRMVEQRGDKELARAASDVVGKVSAVLPQDLRPLFLDAPLYAPPHPCGVSDQRVDTAVIRAALRENRKIAIGYVDEKGARTERTVWPISLAYFEFSLVMVTWCELRSDFRHFRTDRIEQMQVLDQRYPERRQVLLGRWKKQMYAEDGGLLQSVGS
jgi:predicted DNA-binding transcriptional regulator YafY